MKCVSITGFFLFSYGQYGKNEEVLSLTGAIVKLAVTAASGTFEKVLVCVAVVFVTWIKAVGTIFCPPPEHVVKPNMSMKSCCPWTSSVTAPLADDKTWE